MPVKLTAKENKVIAMAVVVSAVALATSMKYFWRAFPEASIDFRVNRADSAPLAEKFLAERGLCLEGYGHAVVFDYDDQTKLYLERTQGLARMNGLTRGPIRIWRWSHRWFKPQQKEEVRVDVTPAGEVVGFDHEIPESAAGANLDVTSARSLAEKFLREVMRRDLGDLEFVEAETNKRPARTDQTFTWKQRSVLLGDGSLRVQVEVDGDQVAGYHEFVKIPEQWSRDYEKLRSRNTSAQVVDEVLWVFLTVAMGIFLVLRLRDRDVPVRLAWGLGLVAAVLYFLSRLNAFSLVEFGYQTTDPYSSFLASFLLNSLLSALAMGAFIFLLVAGSEPVYRENFPALTSLRRTLSWQGIRTRSFFMANVVGIALTFFFFAYQVVFYLVANKLGAWAPSDIPFTNELNTRIPWVGVLFTGFFPAVSEEMQFRAFAIPFLARLLRSWPLALVLAAFNWGFLHSAYPNQPFFIRGIEVGVGGIVTGLFMLRFGILATLIWHYSVDALYTAFLLLRSTNHYLMISGGVTAGIMLIPLIVAGVAYWRTGTFADESSLSNASEGVSRPPPRKEPEAKPETPLKYVPLDMRRIVLAGILTATFIRLALVPVYRFGEGIKLGTQRKNAVRLAADFLKQQKVETATYRRVAWLHENVDPLALRYLFERRSVKEADQIYRQATRLVLWEVRYFRPLEKEEHRVLVDAAAGQVFGYRHRLDENAPGASLPVDQARALAENSVEQHGYRLTDFELQDSQEQKRKARKDYSFTWQAKPGDSRNVGDVHYRLVVDLAGDQVVGLSRYFKIPEDWERERRATRLPNQILFGISSVLRLGLVAGGLILFVRQLRRGEIAWRSAAKVGAALVALMVLGELNQLAAIEQQYDTSISLASFWLRVGVGLVIVPLVVGLLGWVLMGLASSFFPDAWRIFRSSARRVWRRDATVAVVVSLTAGAALERLTTVVASRFHAFAPVRIDLFPDLFNSYSPGAAVILQSLLRSVFYAALAAPLVHAVRLGVARRAWWLWLGGLLFLVSLGPVQAHSLPEFALGWATNFVAVVVAVGIVALFFRNNVLAYVLAAFCFPLAEPLVLLLSQPAAFFLWNGVVLAFLTLIVLGGMLEVGKKRQPVAPAI